MATQVQLRRGTSTQNDAFTGAQGELTYDTTNKRVRIHDGGTAGGFEIKTEDGSGNTIFADNEKAIFGAGSDLQIYHDSANSYIEDVATGSLIIRGTDLHLQDREGNDYIGMEDTGTGGTVRLKHNASTKLTTTSTGIDIGVGTASVYTDVNIKGASTSNYGAYLGFLAGGTTFGKIANYGRIQGGTSNDFFITTATTNNLLFGINNTEKARIDSSGNLLVAKTSSTSSTVGCELDAIGRAMFTRASGISLLLNRTTDDGSIAEFRKDNSVVGSIATNGGRPSFINPTYGGLKIGTGYSVDPATTAGAGWDNSIDLGAGGTRWKNLYLSGGIGGDGTISMSFAPGGNIGVGNTGPGYPLDVGTSSLDKRGRFQGNNQYRLGLQNGTSNLVWLGSGGADNFRISNSAGSTRFELDSAGRGTFSSTSDNTVSSGTGIVNVNLEQTRQNGKGPFIGFRVPNHATLTTNEDMGAIGFVATDSNTASRKADFVVYTRDTTFGEKFRVQHNGNTGIGVTSPSQKLDVRGTVHLGVSGQSSGDVTGTLSIGNTGTNYMTFIKAINTASTPAILRTRMGFFTLSGVGETSAHATEKMSILADSGNVGIGNTNPTSKLTVNGSLSKSSGSFKIDHPLESKKDTHHLVHSFVEAPQADNIYRGVVTLVNGSATINLDNEAGMSEGTFVLLNTNTSCFTSNESDWDAVKGSVLGNILTISCQNTSSTATVSWLVIGERHDQHMIDTEWTDENGKVIVEPVKV